MLDGGPGFEPGEEDAVLERFYRGRAGRQGPEGTGLGLSDRHASSRRNGTGA